MAEGERIDQAMQKILSVSKTELQRRLEAEKKAKKGRLAHSPLFYLQLRRLRAPFIASLFHAMSGSTTNSSHPRKIFSRISP